MKRFCVYLLAICLLFTCVSPVFAQWITKPPPGVSVNWVSPDAQGLVGYWLLNEGTGNQAGDLSGKGNHGTLYGPTWVPGKDGWALSFNGGSDSINCGSKSSIDLNTANGFSIGVWANFNALGNLDQMLIKSDSINWATPSDYDYRIGKNTSNNIQFAASNGSSHIMLLITSTAPITVAGGWYYIVGTWNGTTSTNGIKVYVNGKLEGQGTATGSVSGMTTANSLRIGGYPAVNGMTGQLDDLRLLGCVLSAAEVKQLYINPYAMLQQQQVWQWFIAPPSGVRRLFFVH